MSGTVENMQLDDWQNGRTSQTCHVYMFEKQLGCDVTVTNTSSNDVIGSHRYILVSRSPVFSQMLLNMSPSAEIKIRLADCTFQSAIAFLRFLYTDQPVLSAETVIGVLSLAKQYKVNALRDLCVQFIMTQISTENTCLFLSQAVRYQQEDLYDHCMQFILSHVEEVLRTEGFLELSLTLLDDILSRDNMNIDEKTIYEAVMMWVRQKLHKQNMEPTFENIRNILGETLYKIRFPLLDLSFFSTVIANEAMLTDPEKILLFRYFTQASREVGPFNKTPRRAPLAASRPSATVHTVHRFSRQVGPLTCHFKDVADANRKFALTFTPSVNIVVKGFLLFKGTKPRSDIQISIFSGEATLLHTEHQEIFSSEGSTNNFSQVTLFKSVHLNAGSAYTLAIRTTSPCTYQGLEGQMAARCGHVNFEFYDSVVPEYSSANHQGDLPGLLFSMP